MEPDVERLLDYFKTAEAPHTGRSLRHHLMATFELLTRWGNSRHVCLAGLFHSIYGTEIYTHASANLAARNTIRDAIGGRAEELAYLFCACDRRDLLSKVEGGGPFVLQDRFTNRLIPLDRPTFAALLEIAVANELEQLPDTTDVSNARYAQWRGRWTRCIPFLSMQAAEALQARLGEPQSRQPR
jgi:hypothetical protein